MGGRGRIAKCLAATLVVLALAAGLASCANSEDTSGGTGRTAPALPGVRVGLIANTLDGGLGREQDQVLRLGVRWIREELAWNDIEPHRGELRWRRIDALFRDAARRRMHILPLLNGTAPWLAGRAHVLPSDRAAWAAFVAAAVGRYGPNGTFWRAHPELDRRLAPRMFELWNEPYLESSSAGGPDPVRFAKLFRAGVTAGRRADPAVRYLLPSEAAYTRRDGTLGNWLEDVLAADPDLGRFIDAVAAHPYSLGDPSLPQEDPRLRFRRLDDIRATLLTHGLGDRRLWITELGWSTCVRRPDCVTEGQQAQYLRRAFAMVRDDYRGFIEAVFIYHLRSGPPRSSGTLAWYGLLRYDASRKPAWDVVRRAAVAAG